MLSEKNDKTNDERSGRILFALFLCIKRFKTAKGKLSFYQIKVLIESMNFNRFRCFVQF